MNAAQIKEVIEHLPTAIAKAVDLQKLFDLDHWIAITTDVVTPALTKLCEDEAATAAAELGKPRLVPLSDIAAQEDERGRGWLTRAAPRGITFVRK